MGSVIKITLTTALTIICITSFAQSKYSNKNTVNYKYLNAKVVDSKTDEVIEDFGYEIPGVIVFIDDNGTQRVGVSLGTEMVYNITIVDTFVEYPAKDIKIETLLGGVIMDNNTGTISVSRTWDLSKDKITPQCISTHVGGADISFKFYDISIVTQ